MFRSDAIETRRRSVRPIHVVAVIGTVAAAAVWEWISGRPPICPCGKVALWAGNVHGPENSQMIADWYSLSHIVHGLLFFLLLWLIARRLSVGTRLMLATVVEALWEIAENSPTIIERYRSTTLAAGYSGDSIVNSMSDIGFMIVGFIVASRIAVPTAVAFALALEFVALASIRDNLTLNVLMLLHPIETIRRWQGG